MSKDNELNVKFGAEISGLQSGSKEASNAFGQATQQMQQALQNLNTNMSTMTQTMISDLKAGADASSGSLLSLAGKMGVLGIAAAGAAVAFLAFKTIQSTLEAFTSYASNVESLSLKLGMTAAAASSLAATLRVAGISSDEYMGIMLKMDRQLKTHEENFTKLGVAVRAANGDFLPQAQILDNVIKKMKEYKPGADQMEFAMSMLGPRGAQVAFELMHMSEAAAIAAPMMKDLGLEMSGPDTEAARKFGYQTNALGLTWDALKVKVGQEVIPQLGGLMKALMECAGPVITAAINSTKMLINIFIDLAYFVRLAADAIIGTLLAVSKLLTGVLVAAVKVMQGDFKGAWASLVSGVANAKDQVKVTLGAMVDDHERTAKAIDAIWKKQSLTGSNEKMSGNKKFVAPDAKKEKAPPSMMGQWEEELKEKQVAEEKWFGLSIAEEKAYWESKLAIASNVNNDYISVLNKVNEAIIKGGKESVQQNLTALKGQETDNKLSWDVRLAAAEKYVSLVEKYYGKDTAQYQAALNEQTKLKELQVEDQKNFAAAVLEGDKQAATASIALAREKFNTAVDLGQTSKEKEIAQLKTFLDQEYQLEVDAQTKKVNAETVGTAKWQEELNKRKAIIAKWNLDVQKLNDDTTKDLQKKWKAAMMPITDAFAQGFTDMLNGTKSFKDGLLSIFKSIGDYFINNTIKTMINDWLLGETDKMAISTLFSKAMTALGITQATEAAGAKKAVEVPAALKSIATNAAVGASGAEASQASIPYVGPVLAAAAGVAMLGEILAFQGNVSSAARGYDIPPGVNPLTKLHGEEMVLPSGIAGGFRKMFQGGNAPASSNRPMTVNVQSFDSKDFGEYMKRNGRALFKSLAYSSRSYGGR